MRSRPKSAVDGIAVKHSFPDEATPSQPLFGNYFELSRLAADIFLDVGVVTTEQVMKARETNIIEVAVVERLAMSVQSFLLLHQKVNSLFEALQAEGIVNAKPGD